MNVDYNSPQSLATWPADLLDGAALRVVGHLPVAGKPENRTETFADNAEGHTRAAHGFWPRVYPGL